MDMQHSNEFGEDYSESQRSTAPSSAAASIAEEISLPREHSHDSVERAEAQPAAADAPDVMTSRGTATVMHSTIVHAQIRVDLSEVGLVDAPQMLQTNHVSLTDSQRAQPEPDLISSMVTHAVQTRPVTAMPDGVSPSQVEVTMALDDAQLRTDAEIPDYPDWNRILSDPGLHEGALASEGIQDQGPIDTVLPVAADENVQPSNIEVVALETTLAVPFPEIAARPDMHDLQTHHSAGTPSQDMYAASAPGSSIPALSSMGHSSSQSIAESIECDSDCTDNGGDGTCWSPGIAPDGMHASCRSNLLIPAIRFFSSLCCVSNSAHVIDEPCKTWSSMEAVK